MDEISSLNLIHLKWEDIQRLSDLLAAKIIENNYNVDIIVAVSRGGFDPARILCDQLDVKRLASVQIEYYAGVAQKKTIPQIIYPLNADVSNLNVLVVDDVSDTGDSLIIARDHVIHGGANTVKVATLHVKPWTSFRPDYYAEETEAWIVYPWEVKESIRSISAKFLMNGLNQNEIKERLINLGFREDQFHWLS